VVEPTGALTLAAWRRLIEGTVDGVSLADGPTVLVISGGNVDDDVLTGLLSDPALR
jgi:threonine dehydratase